MYRPDPFDMDSLPPERAERIIKLHDEICSILGEKAISRASQIPSPMVEDVRIHVITCPENHPHIDGLFLYD